MPAITAENRVKAFIPMRRFYSVLLVLLCLGSACSDTVVSPNIPDVAVNEQLVVTKLTQDGSYAYIPGGYKGIMVVRQSPTVYLAFERACPYDPTADCAKVEADPSNLFIVDKCCGSQFNFQGAVMAGPASFGLKQYQTSLSGAILHISN